MSGTNGRAPARLAAVGLGRWGRIMASAYYKSDVVELVSCFSRNAERRGRFAADFGCGEDESLEALLARDDIDGLVVTVPNDQHASVIEGGRSSRQARLRREAGGGGGRSHQADPSGGRRSRESYLPVVTVRDDLAGVREMRRWLDTGEIGTPSMVEAVFSNERGLELKEGDWRGDPAQSPGGPLTQLGIHQIDNLNYLFGVPNRVVGFGRKGAPVVDNTMVVGALLEYDDVIGFLGNDWLTPGAFTMDLYCTKARLRYELDFSWWSDSADTDAHARLIKVQIESDSDDPDARILSERPVQLAARDHLREEIEEFGLAIRGEAQVEVGMSIAVANVAVVLATARAIDQRRAVEISEVQDELRI